MRRSNGYRGVTLIELLIAVILTGLVVMMAFNMLSGEQGNYTHTREKVRLQESAREAVRILDEEVRNAGFRSGVDISNTIAPNFTSCSDAMIAPGSGDSSSFVVHNNSSQAAGDTLDIRYYQIGSNYQVSCGGPLTLQYRVASDTLYRNYNSSGWVPFLANVVAFQVRYGQFQDMTDSALTSNQVNLSTAWAGSLAATASGGYLDLTGWTTSTEYLRTTNALNLEKGSVYRVKATFKPNAGFWDTTNGYGSLSMGFVNSSGSPISSDTMALYAGTLADSNYIIQADIPSDTTLSGVYLGLRARMKGSPTSPKLSISSISLLRVNKGRYLQWYDTPTVAQKNRVKAIRIWLVVRSSKDNGEGVASSFSGLGDYGTFTVASSDSKKSLVQFERIIPVVNNGN
jgi:type II secretory pathway component PulJ